MKFQAKHFSWVMVGLALVSFGAQAAGFDVSGFMTQHADIIGGLALVGFAGEVAVNDPAAIKAALDKISDQVKEKGEEALAEAKKGHDLSQKAKETADELLVKFNGLQAELREVEQKAVSRNAEPPRVKSYGEQIVESEKYKSMMSNGGRGSFSLELKQVTSAAAGALIRPLYETEIVALPQRRFTVRDLLPVVPIATSSVDYPKQTTRTNNAATVAESAAKPYSDYAWSNATAPVRTIAHLAKLTRQAMDDAPRLIGEVDAEMRYGLRLVEEAQLLNGNGTGQNLSGIMTQATAYVAPITIAGATSLDMLRLAMLQAALALYPADGIVLSQQDWARIQLQKTTDGAYLFANPQGTVEARLWGLPVVDTPAMPVDAFLVGAFRFGATLYDRMGIEVLISTENADDFEKNLATMRAEERIALAVKRPGSFIAGDFGLVA
ncbi:phage major capsid protein [Noviherbaspirillum suwonense]|uniref:Phage major capsid protein, HK97 family n=1 Tax=Noviherbaspirillum suwonense TaxID=1224511 RepID=A0ABY1QLU4_9BURK|nr:phage major capsid protein [Noviherbaspirillum suwonense]SMP71919.1 phage major capsid protein, HK97 family [Noviherbaspirillum suwonense]